jgi:ligand-binding sensor domain-containing protein/signal transduction histidine kinase
MRCCLIAGLFWLAAMVDAAAIEYTPSLTRFRRVGTEQGLSQASAWAMVQDRRGFVWIATQDGLNRFDGHEFRVYRQRAGQADSLPGDLLQALVIDPAGTLWVGGSGGLSRYLEQRDGFESVPVDGESGAQAGVRGLHVDATGVLWIASYAGLSRYDPKVGKRSAWDFAPDNAPPDTRFETVHSDSEGRIWLGSLAGLSRLDPASGRVDWPYEKFADAAPLKSSRVDALLRDRDGVLWIGAVTAGLFRYDVAGNTLRVFRHRVDDPATLNSDIIRSLLQDRDGRLWIGTREGLNVLPEPNAASPRFQRFAHHRQDPRSLGPGRVMSLLETTDGSLLAGTYTGGVSVLNPRGNRFTSYTPDSAATTGLRDPVIYSLLAAGPDAIWLGGRNGLYRFQPDTGQLQDFPATAGLGVSALTMEGSEIWIGVLSGAMVVDSITGGARRPALPPPLDNRHITQIWLDEARIIAGTYDRGVYVLRRGDMSQIAHYPVASWVSHFAILDADTLLVCSSDGLLWLSRDGQREIHAHRASSEPGAPLPAGGITHYLRAGDGRMWLASTSGGLLRMHLQNPADPASARFESFPQFSALSGVVIQAIAEDGEGQLWLATSKGIFRFDPDSGELTQYGAADGAFEGDYQSAAVAKLADGRIVFAATRGFTVFDPARIEPTPSPPAPLLTELRLWNRRVESRALDPTSPLPAPLHVVGNLSIPAADARMLSLRFAALDLLAPERLHYAYRLDGFDPDWIETTAGERSATYTNLAPGRYRFRVKAGEPGSLSDAAITNLMLDILPPWWKSPWAQAMFALAVLGALYGSYAWRVRGMQTNRRLLQRQVDERTAELSQAKQRAEQTLIELNAAQSDLIQAEKMAAIASLVVGVAHEMNTPLGVAVTASSHLTEHTARLQQLFAAGELRRADLGSFFDTAQEASLLVDRNLERAAQLIDSFKQISADNSAEQRRQFVLGDYLRGLLLSLEMASKPRPIDFELAVKDGLVLDSYPGALAQIVSNLIQNALVHAFADDRNGTLKLAARALEGDRVEISVSDNGSGISAEVLPHVFEPFYTTRRGRGGTGLGLHIVYNLVNVRLGGQIEVQSGSSGTRVVLTIPRVAK